MAASKSTTAIVICTLTAVLYLFFTYSLQQYDESQLGTHTSSRYTEASQTRREKRMKDTLVYNNIRAIAQTNAEARRQKHSFLDASLLISPCKVSGVTVDCSQRSLTNIEPYWFPSNTELILMNDNLINILSNKVFSHLVNLTYLEMSQNEIKLIEPYAFNGLRRLRYLGLGQNNINFSSVYNFTEIFKHIPTLVEINIMQNNGIYNVTFLEPLMSLEILSMDFDSPKLIFGPGFTKMKNLRILKLSGNFSFVDEQSFENVYHLKKLYIVHPNDLNTISQNAFKPLQSLSILSFYIVRMSTQYLLSILEPFQGRNMTELSIVQVSMNRAFVDPQKEGYITAADTKFLLNICLSKLVLSSNKIHFLATDSFSNLNTWNKCLKEIVITNNEMTGSILAVLRIIFIRNLQRITLNILRACSHFAPFPNSLSIGEINNKEEAHFTFDNSVSFYNWISSSFNKTTYKNFGRPDSQVVRISESIRYIDIKSSISSQSMRFYFTFIGAQNVEYLDISNSGLREFVGKIEGFTSLKTAIFSGNDVSILSNSYFDTFPALRNVACIQCKLDRNFLAFESRRLFQNVTLLEQLDVSSNLLNYLSKDTFSYNPHLKFLNLSRNQFREIPFSLRYTPDLSVLDLRENSITTFDVDTMRELDILESRSGNFKLFLDGNVLSCGCNDFKFLQWMRLTSITFDQNGNFTCMNKEGERSYTLKYTELDSLWRECWGEVFFYLALILLCLYAIGVFIVFILLKNKHFVVSYFLQTFGGFKLHTRQDYPIDVYIGYSDIDYQFPCHVLRQFIENTLHLNTFINDRDLIASVDKADGIMNAINSSWRILLVCTERFLLDDEWSMFTIKSAIYTQSPANPSRVVVILHENCLTLLPPELLSSVNDENILVVSDWTMSYEMTQMLMTRFKKTT